MGWMQPSPGPLRDGAVLAWILLGVVAAVYLSRARV